MIPQSFKDMPRWWRDGSQWLDALPGLVRAQCSAWHLTVAGEAMHGSNALVVPVTRDGDDYVLRLSPPGPEVTDQVAALRFWAGRGTVALIEADAGAMLLERLGGSLADVPVAEAMHVLGRTMRRLAVPAPAGVPSTATVVARRMAAMERPDRPFDRAILRHALDIGSRLSRTTSGLAVDGDLHSAQVLRGRREPWLVVDPVLMRGDIAYDLGRILWTRLDEMTNIAGHFDEVVRAADLDRDHARDWVFFRAVDYWLWGLTAGLTEDPERCRRLVAAVA
ncbi:aminoglycoside phosphotransferase family protein [Paractinoplanes durhamensis]|uniref:Aminoglycoside O-phosphotransferase n=1 Tax=Paractinoplanes durhamensis TaxID=113563 RepID=A0ABQ3YSS2_9ACTN|nr:aminoglycoside phosphotransferase family protein [Actinoplanes durhamensis]GIE00632.1 aminoglycoside O-phosphotransferase [Actinoplanes durhamensis]